MARRKHPKVATLPLELQEAIHQRLLEGWTYRDITDWLNEKGHAVSKSAIGRYGKDFHQKLERVKILRDQARAIMESNAEAPATELAEATSQLAVSLIMETLMQLDDLQGAKVTELLKVLPKLEQSGVLRERLKLEYRKKAETVVSGLDDALLAGKSPEEIREIIRQRVREEYGS
ncbi:MAG: DUF3486 family protein [Firmicutes bacterium]|nr:DUF3486 family protein [Bacillota bacterium]